MDQATRAAAAIPESTTGATIARRSVFGGWPVWARLVAAIAVLLLVAWSAMVFLTYEARRDAAIAEARDFAESSNQMIVATLTGMMITGVSKDRAVFLDQVKNTNNINDVQVFRTGSVLTQYGAGDAAEANPSAEEKAVMQSAQPSFTVNEQEGYLRAIFPIVNSHNFLGKDCTGCHEGSDKSALGAVSMKVNLKKSQAELQKFTGWIALIALGLSLPVLGAVYLLIRGLVGRPLGGEPSAATELAGRIAGGDLSAEVAVKSGDTSSLIAAMAGMQRHLSDVIGQIRQGADVIALSASEIATGNADLSQRTEEQASSLEETASSMEELTSTVKQNAENARQANQLAVGASDVAVKGGSVVRQVVDTMSGISESSRKISDIIGVIDGIAFQTNILALNAAVEAARAGEQGRGFAVVASEVRNLAQRSAAAAKEIKQLIEDSVHKVDAGTKLVDEAGTTMDEIVASVKRVTDIMAEITAASHEQSSGIEQVNQAITQMDEVTQQNAALVEQAAAAAESMQEQAQSLAQAVSVFRTEHRNEHSGSQPARAPAGHSGSAVDRRSPKRATNVARLTARHAAHPSAPPAGQSEPRAKKVANAGNEWEEF